MAVTDLPPAATLTFRDEPRAEDLHPLRGMVAATGFFSAAELAVALELVEDRLTKGVASDYRFVLAASGGELVGYTCFGPVAATVASWDLYWIVVDPAAQGRGWGRALLAESERRMALGGGHRVYVETSSRAQYAPTRAFYERCGYRQEALLADFYAPGDGKVIFVKELAEGDADG
jgi:ribosomal protein S18 acetylase RimI-like enzyme